MRYLIDIDGTICEHCDNPNFGKGEVFHDRISYINNLYNHGNEIIYYTARGMGEFDGDVNLANQKWFDYTHQQLEEWKCQFHKLIVGKYSGDCYVDDKAINCDDFFKNCR